MSSSSIALAAYQEGATPLLTVLDAERTRAEVRQQYFKTIFDYQIALAELARRCPGLHLAPDQRLTFHPNISFRGPQVLRVRTEP